MASCDLCGGNCKASDMAQLLPSYQVPGVVDVCPACSAWAGKLKLDILGEHSERMRAAIRERKGAPVEQQLPMRWWWYVFFRPISWLGR